MAKERKGTGVLGGGAWGDIIYRETDAGNKTTNYKNFWEEDATTWRETGENGKIIQYDQVRRNGQLVSSRATVIDKGRVEERGAGTDDMDSDDVGFDLLLWVVYLLIKFIIFMFVAMISMMAASYAVPVILGVFIVTAVFKVVFRYRLYSSYWLSAMLKKKLYVVDKVKEKYRKKGKVSTKRLQMIFKSGDWITTGLKRKLGKKKSMGVEELLLYDYYRQLYEKDVQLLLTDKLWTEVVDRLNISALHTLCKSNLNNYGLQLGFEPIYTKYAEINEWYIHKNKSNSEFIKKVNQQDEYYPREINVNSIRNVLFVFAVTYNLVYEYFYDYSDWKMFIPFAYVFIVVKFLKKRLDETEDQIDFGYGAVLRILLMRNYELKTIRRSIFSDKKQITVLKTKDYIYTENNFYKRSCIVFKNKSIFIPVVPRTRE